MEESRAKRDKRRRIHRGIGSVVKNWRDGIPDAKAWLNARSPPSLTQAREADPPEIAALREKGRMIEDGKRPALHGPELKPDASISGEVDAAVQAELDAEYAEIIAHLKAYEAERQKEGRDER
jgi:hypothetical protein